MGALQGTHVPAVSILDPNYLHFGLTQYGFSELEQIIVLL